MREYFHEDGVYHLRSNKHTCLSSEEISVMVDLKHKFVLHHGSPVDIEGRFESLKKNCYQSTIAKKDFDDYIFVFTKSDWSLSELNGFINDCKNVPFWMKKKIIVRKAMGRIK